MGIYESTGPNSNNFVQNIVGREGGTAEFPSNAFGAVGIIDGLFGAGGPTFSCFLYPSRN
jgi:hypothetical protein